MKLLRYAIQKSYRLDMSETQGSVKYDSPCNITRVHKILIKGQGRNNQMLENNVRDPFVYLVGRVSPRSPWPRKVA